MDLHMEIQLENYMVYEWGKPLSIIPFAKEAIRLVNDGDPTACVITDNMIYTIENDYTPTAEEFVEHFKLEYFLEESYE